MSRSGAGRWTFLIVAIVLAAVFARLGMWQLDRLAERRDANRLIRGRMEVPPAELTAGVRDVDISPDGLAWRSVRVSGTWDLEREIVVRGRASRGTPGVHVVTPLLLDANRAVLVLRGWLPAADGLSADLAGARPHKPGLEVEVQGLVMESEAPSPIPPRTRRFEGSERLVLGALTIEQAAGSLPYELLPVFVLLTEPAGFSGAPFLLDEPTPSDGPHLWYAAQWFAFAIISLGGAVAYVRTRPRSASSEGDAS